MLSMKSLRVLRSLAHREDGATMMEYALLASLAMVVLAIAALALLKG